jgi:HAD superfamily hydrolase (TIGR01509 family)
LNKFHAIIFDMDGLLLDSEKIALSTFVASCRECNFEPDVKIYRRCLGTNFARTQEILLEGYGKEFPLEAIVGIWRKKYKEDQLSKPIPVKTGALSLLQYLEQKGIKKAVVTSTFQEGARIKLTNAKMVQFFDFILGGDQISNSKPDPEIYSKACQMLNEKPEVCLALEDSDNGVLSASKAGLTVIQVPDMLEPAPGIKELGHKIVKSLVEAEEIIRQLDLGS